MLTRAHAPLSTSLQRGVALALMFSASAVFAGCSRTAARTDATDSSGAAATAATSEASNSATGSAADDDTATRIVDAAGGVASPATSPTTSPDTARGVVQRMGAEPLTTLLLVPRDGAAGQAYALEGAAQAELLAAEGLEVVVRGTRTTQRAASAGPSGAPIFQVTQFAVRAADGIPARDGVLVQVNGAWMLESATGARSTITGLPAALQSQRGARIFLVGPAAQAPQAFGVLRAK